MTTLSDMRWRVLAIVSVAQLMIVLDVTIANVALPSMQRDLGFGADVREWIVTAYSLAFGSLLLLGGRVADLLGPRVTLVAGVLGFAGASAVGGAAGSFGVLVAARAAQGACGALLAPAALSLLATTFADPAERGRAFGIFGAVAVSGSAIGLLLGGALTDALSWRWALYVNLGFAVPVAIAALVTLAPTERHPARVDAPGGLAAASGLFLLIFGLSQAQRSGWADAATIAGLAAAVVLLVAFVAIEARTASPLLPLRIPADAQRGGAYLAIAFNSVGMFSTFLFLTYFLQGGLGYSPIQTGLAFLPLAVSVIAMAMIVTPRVLPRTGPRPLLTIGPLLGAAGMIWLAQLSTGSGYATHVLPGLILVGLAAGFTVAPAMATATRDVPRRDAGVAGALVNTMQQLGGAIGLSALGTIAGTHGDYGTVFGVAAGVYVAAAVLCAVIVRTPRVVPEAA